MKIKLESDFNDYYDSAFCADSGETDLILKRISRDGPSQSEVFSLFENAKFLTPRFGKVSEVVKRVREELSNFPKDFVESFHIVVHVDEKAHGGDGKKLLTIGKAEKKHPDALGVEYLPTLFGTGSTSYRYLRIGVETFVLKYTSKNDWRSNCGENDIKVLKRTGTVSHQVNFFAFSPILAIDYLLIGKRFYAISLNTGPVLGGTGLESIMNGEDIHASCVKWFEEKLRIN